MPLNLPQAQSRGLPKAWGVQEPREAGKARTRIRWLWKQGQPELLASKQLTTRLLGPTSAGLAGDSCTPGPGQEPHYLPPLSLWSSLL